MKKNTKNVSLSTCKRKKVKMQAHSPSPNPVSYLEGTWLCHFAAAVDCWSVKSRTCLAISFIQPRSLAHQGHSGMSSAQQRDTEAQTLSTCRIPWRLVHWRRLKFSHLSGRDATTYCVVKWKPSDESSCPVQIPWKTSPQVESLFTDRAPQLRITFTPLHTLTDTSIARRAQTNSDHCISNFQRPVNYSTCVLTMRVLGHGAHRTWNWSLVHCFLYRPF